MIITGVDPGKGGAMVTLFEDGSTLVNRVPLKKIGKKTKPEYVEWARSWRTSILLNPPDVFVMEQVEARPGQGVVSMFNFGKATGFAMAVIMYVDAPVHYALPTVWKAKMGLIGFDKSKSVELAKELIPSLIPELTRVKDTDVAEAGLLAYYGRMTISG